MGGVTIMLNKNRTFRIIIILHREIRDAPLKHRNERRGSDVLLITKGPNSLLVGNMVSCSPNPRDSSGQMSRDYP